MGKASCNKILPMPVPVPKNVDKFPWYGEIESEYPKKCLQRLKKYISII